MQLYKQDLYGSLVIFMEQLRNCRQSNAQPSASNHLTLTFDLKRFCASAALLGGASGGPACCVESASGLEGDKDGATELGLFAGVVVEPSSVWLSSLIARGVEFLVGVDSLSSSKQSCFGWLKAAGTRGTPPDLLSAMKLSSRPAC